MMRDDDFCNLQMVHPVLAATFLVAAARYRVLLGDRAYVLRITDGLRNRTEQERLVREGKSRTLESGHLRGMAIDVAFLSPDRSQAHWELHRYREFNALMQRAFDTFRPHLPPEASLIWGGDWKRLVDGVHWELNGVPETQAPWL